MRGKMGGGPSGTTPRNKEHLQLVLQVLVLLRGGYAVCGVMTPWMVSMYLARGSM